MTDLKAKHGGVRPGSGRKPVQPVLCSSPALLTSEPTAFLIATMNEPTLDMRLRVDAAKALLRAAAAQGTKASSEDAAKRALSGRFAPSAPPSKQVWPFAST